MMMPARKMVKPDPKGRITLGHLADGVSRFAITVDTKHHRIILEPFVEIPAREQWLYDNPTALKSVQQGLKDAAEGRVFSLGSFAKYADDDIEE